MSNKDLNYKLGLDTGAFSKGMSEAVSQTGQLDSKMSAFSKGGLMGSIVGGNLLTGAIQKAGGAILDFEKDSIRAFGQQEQFLTSLQTMFHGNTLQAQLLNDQLKTFAQTTPFELTEIQDATKMMIAYGSKAGGVVEEMRMLGDISSGVGSSLSEVAYLYGTLRTQGRAYAMDIRQFTGRGIPIIAALAKQFGVADSAIMKMVEDGKIGFKDVEKALKSMTEEGGQFAGMMDKQSKTLNGQLSNLADSWEQLKVSIGESQSGILKSTTSFITSLVNDLNRGIGAANRLEKSLQMGNAKSFGFFESHGVPSEDYMKYGALSEEIKKKYVDKASKSEGQAAIQYNELGKLKRNITEQYGKGTLSATDYNRQMALLNTARDEVKQIQDNFKELKGVKGDKQAGKAGNASSQSKLGSTAEISGAKPQSIVINITKLIEDMTISTTNLKESATKIREEVAKALLEAVNDVNILARAT